MMIGQLAELQRVREIHRQGDQTMIPANPLSTFRPPQKRTASSSPGKPLPIRQIP